MIYDCFVALLVLRIQTLSNELWVLISFSMCNSSKTNKARSRLLTILWQRNSPASRLKILHALFSFMLFISGVL